MTTPGDGPSDHRSLLLGAYAAFNARDAEALLARVSDDVDWPDGHRRLHGKEEVRRDWTGTWARARTHDEPVGFSELDDGRIAVRVDQVVCSHDGAVISRGRFLHLHRIERGLITRMDIEAVAEP